MRQLCLNVCVGGRVLVAGSTLALFCLFVRPVKSFETHYLNVNYFTFRSLFGSKINWQRDEGKEEETFADSLSLGIETYFLNKH